MVIAPVLANLGPLEELNFKPNPGEVRSSAIFCLFEKNRVRLELTSLMLFLTLIYSTVQKS